MAKSSTLKIMQVGIIIFAILCFSFPRPTAGQEKGEHDPLRYDVSVNVIVVPIFAVDQKGKPVYDLKEGDIELYVNNQPMKILQFKRYEFEDQQVEKTVKKVEKETSPEPTETPGRLSERVIFVIIDSMFTDTTGFRRSKKIAEELVEKASAGDRFVILENRPEIGLAYIAGPEPAGKDLLKKVKGLKVPIQITSREAFQARETMKGLGFDNMASDESTSRTMLAQKKLKLSSEKMFYRNMLARFSYVLSQLKYALRTINKPKVVFLISEGPARGGFKSDPLSLLSDKTPYDDYYTKERWELEEGEIPEVKKSAQFESLFMRDERTAMDQDRVYSAFLFDYLKRIIRSINSGGSVLYTINPRRLSDTFEDDVSGDEGLFFLANESGGKYFSGNDPEVVVEQIKTTTAAYYELVFAPKPEMGSNMRIAINSKRPGVRAHTLSFAEREKPYVKMDKVQKKIFALNVVKEGSWSRMVGKVVKMKFKKQKKDKSGDKVTHTIEVPIPNEMRNQNLDIFVLRVNPDTHKTDILIQNVVGPDRQQITLSGNKADNLYFAIIEPTNTYCIYNQIQ
jgi:hypothetical protein